MRVRNHKSGNTADVEPAGARIFVLIRTAFWLGTCLVGLALYVTVNSSAIAGQQDASLMNKAFISAQRLQYSETANVLDNVSAQFSAKSGPLADLIKQNRTAKQRFKITNDNLLAALAETQGPSTNRTQSYRKELGELQTLIEQTETQIAQLFPEFSNISNPLPLSIAETQSLMMPNEAIVLMVASEEASFIWAISQDKAQWARVPVSKMETQERIQALRQTLSFEPSGDLEPQNRAAISPFQQRLDENQTDFAYEIAQRLYKQLFQPIEDVIEDKAILGLVTDDTFASLPFATLIATPDDIGADPARNPPWLIKKYALYQLPSLTSLQTLRETAKPSSGQYAFLGIGDPCLGQRSEFCSSQAGDMVANRDDQGAILRGVSALPRLPHTRLELMTLADFFDASSSDLLMSADATESNLKSEDVELGERRIIVFATHGLQAGEIDGLSEPALVLTPPKEPTDSDDGLLSASEIADLSLDADWIILSACNTASADGKSGARTFSGLAQAFFYSGTRSILLSHWSVRDDAAAKITTGTISRLKDDPSLTRAEALQQSMIALMNGSSQADESHPRVWAPFALLGDGR